MISPVLEVLIEQLDLIVYEWEKRLHMLNKQKNSSLIAENTVKEDMEKIEIAIREVCKAINFLKGESK